MNLVFLEQWSSFSPFYGLVKGNVACILEFNFLESRFSDLPPVVQNSRGGRIPEIVTEMKTDQDALAMELDLIF